MNKQDPIVIIGGGISGLALAAFLKHKGLQPHVLEKGRSPGGVVNSLSENGLTYDFGTNSAIEKNAAVLELFDILGIQDEVVYANPESSKRLILKNEHLHSLKGPASILLTSLFSFKAKMKAFGEFRRPPKKDNQSDTLAEFVLRRFGPEILEYAVNPLISGIHAGDPKRVSIEASFPEMARAEREYGSVIKGMGKIMKAKKEARKAEEEEKQARGEKVYTPSRNIFSFREGMQVFPKRIASYLGNAIDYHATVTHIAALPDGGYEVSYSQNGNTKTIKSPTVISTAPAYALADIVNPLSEKLGEHLRKIYYPPMIVLNLTYKKSAIGRKLDSFGFLIPEKENKSFLGAIWSSVIFPNRAPEDMASFILYIGGARYPKLLQGDYKTHIEQARYEFEAILNISHEPVHSKFRAWEHAIPQYELHHLEIIRHIEEFEARHPGLHISGNFRKGFALGDCVQNAHELAHKLASPE